jgi:hypothetical protein
MFYFEFILKKARVLLSNMPCQKQESLSFTNHFFQIFYVAPTIQVGMYVYVKNLAGEIVLPMPL